MRRENAPFYRIILIVCLMLALILGGCITGADYDAPPAPPLASLPSLSSVVSKVLPSVVYIYVETSEADSFGHPVNATGSGVIMRSDGYILTNRHVVDKAVKIEVTLQNRRNYMVDSNNVWRDDITDLAVVKIDEQRLPVLQFSDPGSLNVGDWVVAIGHALGFSPLEGGPTVTKGIVSNLNRSITIATTDYYDLIQTDAAINPGNSGGPLVDLQGNVVGINSAGASDAQNIGFAINTATARHVFEDLIQYGHPHHPFLGASLGDVTAGLIRRSGMAAVGAVIEKTEPDSPAALAGLTKDDTIVRFGQDEIDSAAALMRALWRHEPGDTAEVVFWRGATRMQITITLGQRPQTCAAV